MSSIVYSFVPGSKDRILGPQSNDTVPSPTLNLGNSERTFAVVSDLAELLDTVRMASTTGSARVLSMFSHFVRIYSIVGCWVVIAGSDGVPVYNVSGYIIR